MGKGGQAAGQMGEAGLEVRGLAEVEAASALCAKQGGVIDTAGPTAAG